MKLSGKETCAILVRERFYDSEMPSTRNRERGDYFSKTPDEKKSHIAALLFECKNGNQDLEDVYEYVTSEFSSEEDFDEIFETVMGILEATDEKSSQTAKNCLSELRARLEAVLLKERSERPQEIETAEAALRQIP